MFERFRQLARTRLHLVEQPYIIDRDHGLVGESRDQLDLTLGERPDHVSNQHDHANEIALVKQGHPENPTLPADTLPVVVRELRIGKNIGDVDRSAFERRAPGGRPAIDRNGVLLEPSSMFRVHTARCSQMDFVVDGLPIKAYSAEQSRAAVPAIASSTGCTWEGERLMTLSTSLVAV
jgi:hypothetical protein